jgi:multidrug efflux pump subunit AcrA (membrane-fusion protein)
MKKAIIWLVVIAFVILAGYRGWVSIQKSKQGKVKIKEETVASPVKVDIVRQIPFTETLSLFGDVKGIEEVKVFPKVSGKLYDIKVKEGDKVEKGSIIALIDRDVTGLEFKLAEVTSPIAGVISGVYLDRGAGVSPPNPSPSMGTALVGIINMDTVIVTVSVIEKDISKIKLGQKAHIRVDAYPQEEFTGRVTSINPAVDLTSRTAAMEITIPNLDHRLKSGMFAQVEIIIGEKPKAILVHSYSILESGDQKIVYVVENGKAVSRIVETGNYLADSVEVISGLKSGDTLIVSGQHGLGENSIVNIVEGGME